MYTFMQEPELPGLQNLWSEKSIVGSNIVQCSPKWLLLSPGNVDPTRWARQYCVNAEVTAREVFDLGA
jgi:hypothetical protein